MSKRFIDTETLLRPSIRVCPTPYKLFWIALITRCDHAGIWVKDFEMINLLCGTKIDENKALEYFGDKIIEVRENLWFIPDFLEFQHPSGLNPKNNAHISAIKILIKYDLWDEEKLRVKVDPSDSLPGGSQVTVTVKDKVTVKAKVKDKEEKEIFTNQDQVDECFERCLTYFPEHLHPKSNQVKSWKETIEKLNRIDRIPFEKIIQIVEKTRGHQFWSKNFLSLLKLRKKNNEGIMYAVVFNENVNNEKTKQSSKSRVEYSEDFKRKIASKVQS